VRMESVMGGGDKFVFGGLIGLFGLAGLFVASRAEGEPMPYWGGLGFMLFAVLFIFFLIRNSYNGHGGHGH